MLLEDGVKLDNIGDDERIVLEVERELSRFQWTLVSLEQLGVYR